MPNPVPMDGILVIDKPRGMISKDVSRWLTRRIGKVKLGHLGTLDPLAEGVLPILFGTATRLQDYFIELPKTYRFQVVFGVRTTTLDSEGEVVETLPVGQLDSDHLREVCDSLVGDFVQVPPIYSAIKFRGKPLYEYARSGRADEVPLNSLKKVVEIKSLKLLKFEGDRATFEVVSSKGTYVRVVAEAIAKAVGTCGYVSILERFSAGGFNRAEALSLEFLETNLHTLTDLLVSIEDSPIPLPRYRVGDEKLLDRLKMGQRLSLNVGDAIASLDDRSSHAFSETEGKVLLLDQGKKSFGIGSYVKRELDLMTIQMRRGL